MSIAKEKSLSSRILDPIMAGIGYMLPCVVAGGILIGVGFMLDDPTIDFNNYGHNTKLADFFTTTGSAIFHFMLPVLCAFIARYHGKDAAIPGGLAAGYLASIGKSGFLGALILGFFVGYLIVLLKRIFDKLPDSLSGTKDLLIIPLVSVLCTGAVTVFFVEPTVGILNAQLTDLLNSLSGSGNVLLGVITGGMESVDMGGPVNKTAYLFATGALSNGVYTIMSAVLAGGIVPPFVTAFASVIFKNKFTPDERKQGYTNFIVGLAGITEGAIPFLVRSPLPVIGSCVVGSGLAGGLSMYLGCSIRAPFGGVFVAPLNSNFGGWMLSVAAGITVGTILLGLSKKLKDRLLHKG